MLLIREEETREVLSVARAAEIIEATYRGIARGVIAASQPSVMRITGEPYRLGAKGAVLHHLGVAGVRLLSRAAPRLMLWSLLTGEPIALIDESYAYRLRTGVSAAVCARFLLRQPSASRVTIIGAGSIAHEVAVAIHSLLTPYEIVVVARSASSAEQFALGTAKADVTVIPKTDVSEAVRNADLVITITSANEVLVRRDDLKTDAAVLSMGGGLEVDYAVWAAAECRFVDDLDYAVHQGDVAAWIAAGQDDIQGIQASVTGTIAALADGTVGDPRQRAGLAMAIVQGTTALDVALAHAVYNQRVG